MLQRNVLWLYQVRERNAVRHTRVVPVPHIPLGQDTKSSTNSRYELFIPCFFFSVFFSISCSYIVSYKSRCLLQTWWREYIQTDAWNMLETCLLDTCLEHVGGQRLYDPRGGSVVQGKKHMLEAVSVDGLLHGVLAVWPRLYAFAFHLAQPVVHRLLIGHWLDRNQTL